MKIQKKRSLFLDPGIRFSAPFVIVFLSLSFFPPARNILCMFAAKINPGEHIF